MREQIPLSSRLPMHAYLNNLPSVTMPEIVVVAVAALFLVVTPAVFAWTDELRRRRRLAAIPTPQPIWPSAAGSTGDLIPEPPLEAPSRATLGDEISWPTEAPIASPDVRSGLDEGFVESTLLLVDAATPMSQPLAEPGLGVSHTTPEPTAESVAAPALEIEEIEVPWVYRGPLMDLLPPPATGQAFQLLELRQARLSNWPPQSVRSDTNQRQLWEEGERLAARHDREISSASLAWPRVLQSTTYAGLSTDGSLHRVRFLLFEDLWPSGFDQAAAEAVFEVSEAGVQRAWVESR